MSGDETETQADGDVSDTEYAVDRLEDGAVPVPSPESLTKPCAACAEPYAAHRLLLTIEWEEYLSDHHGIPYPDGECRVPLCSQCASRAEVLEIAEMSLATHSTSQQLMILDERNRFLESLRPELITNLSVSSSLSNLE